MARLRILPAGTGLLLVEDDDLARTLALMDRLIDQPLPGITELVPAARTVMIAYDPALTDRARISAALAWLDLAAARPRQGREIDIPVRYDGEDLEEVAAHLGWSVETLIRRHTQATYTVAFTGFAPGFAYMTANDPDFDVPRRSAPRVRIPAGSVAIAGRFGGIYPSDSPGGWQLLGRTPLAMWDTAREPPALLQPGDRVRFRAVDSLAAVPVSPPRPIAARHSQPGTPVLTVLRADRPALFQDLGRPGRAGQGIAASGALDRGALLAANRMLGNRRDAPVLEITFGGFALRADAPLTLAVTGATAPLTITTADGRALSAPFGKPFALDAGDRLALGTPATGMRSYLAIRGGFAVVPVIGSASTDTMAKIGPETVEQGAVLSAAKLVIGSVDPSPLPLPPLPRAGETVTLDVIAGPRTDWFTATGLATLTGQDWLVTPQSSRVGMRLSGEKTIERAEPGELPSEGTALGAIQVPHSGEPVLFLADHPLTGGYPVIGSVAAHHIDLAGQVPIGARIRFRLVTEFDPEILETRDGARTAAGETDA